jgi:hypothetical protein
MGERSTSVDAEQFDAMAKAVTFGASRRRVLAGLLGVGLMGLCGGEGAKAKHKPEKPKKPKLCKKAKDCGAGTTCQDGACVLATASCPDPCRHVARLEGGHVCTSGFDIRVTNQPCRDNADCPSGYEGTCSIGDCPIAGPCCHYVAGTSEPCQGDHHCTREPGGVCTLEGCPIAGPCCHYLSACPAA